MLFKWIISIGITFICILNLIAEVSTPGPVYIPLIYIICPILLFTGFGKNGVFTWPLATVLLLLEKHWIVGWLPAILIIVNIFANEWIKKNRRSKYSNEDDITKKFIRYCKEYLIIMKGFNEQDAGLAVLDPYLGNEMDKIKGDWAFSISNIGDDPEKYLGEFNFTIKKMEIINRKLDEYSMIFNKRKESIISYLKDIGYL